MKNQADVLLVGGGQAGTQVAATLRSSGYTGSIVLLEAGAALPYERPPLTKAYLRGEIDEVALQLRPKAFWSEENIDVHLKERVEFVDPTTHEVTTNIGVRYSYGSLVWAAGGSARELAIGAGIEGVVGVRTLEDARALRARVGRIRNVVVIGGGFIGLEAAAVLRDFGINVTILEALDRLLARVTSAPVSEFFANLHRERGADVRVAVSVVDIHQEGGMVTGVELGDGTVLPADLVLVGVGLVPNVGPLAAAGIRCNNGVDVDDAGQTSAPEVYAVGDCANRVHTYSNGARVRMESVPNAVDQGKAVALRIAGLPNPVEPVPWFWSHQFDAKLQTVGLFNSHDDFVVRGDPASGSFSVVYRRGGEVIAIDSINRVRDFAQGKAVVAAHIGASRKALEDVDRPLKSLLESISD
jgi:3-phenylpropionate/trans-cinnamate dioxygenase ferredoxin reductase subunit